MNNYNSINLTLNQPLVYNKERELQTQDINTIYQYLLNKLDNSGIASEACINFKYQTSDSISFEIEEVGYAPTPSEEVIKAVENGETIPLMEHDMAINIGSYKIIQLPFLPDKSNLFATLMQIACSNFTTSSGNLFYRLIKENSIVILAQVIIKLEE
ncbi:MAG: hypothetical protein ACPKM0_10995 [Pleomorphochaeta sp.]